MIGDTLPWFLPLFVFGLLAWVFYEAIETYVLRKGSPFGEKALVALRWLPAAQLVVMLITRSISLIQRDLSHLEVAQYLGAGTYHSSDLKLIATGGGGSEIIALTVILFVLLSERLPSLGSTRVELRQGFRNRLMMFTGLMLLSASTLLFPESAY